MTGVGLQIRVGGDAPAKLRGMIDQIEDKPRFFAAASEIMLDQTQQHFSSQSDPLGVLWTPLAPATVAERGSDSPILERSRQLRAGIHAAPEPTRAVVRTLALPYAAIHQEGGQAGRGRKVTIPARPYLGFGPANVRELVELAETMLLR